MMPLFQRKSPTFHALLVSAATLLPQTAQAAGFELSTPGARNLGRGGAVVVGADDPLGVFVNPANITGAGALIDSAVSLQLIKSSTCFRRTEVNESSTGVRTAGATLPNVCDDGGLAIIPELATTVRLGERWALSIGLYAPPAASAQSKFGNPKTGTLDGGTGEDRPDQRTPSRYLVLQQKQLQVFPTLGLAHQLFPWLRLGASFGWGITKLDFTNAAFSRALIQGSVQAESDISNHLTGVDGFVPRAQIGASTKALPILPVEFGVSYTWTGDVNVTDGKLALTGLNSDIVPPEYAVIDGKPQIRGTIKNVKVKVPQTSQLALGARYASKLKTPADNVGDRLSTERFDIEANAIVTFAKRVDAISVDLPAGSSLYVPKASENSTNPPFTVNLPEHVKLQHQWQNQVSLRLGGDYNPLPGLLGLRAGVSYDGNGVKHGYENIDFTPFTNVGVHAGATVRILHRVDLSLAFAQFFFPDNNVSVADAQVRRVINEGALPSDAHIVNAGRFTRSSSSLALQVGARF